MEIEIKLMYAEKLVADLNEVVTEQAAVQTALERRVAKLERQLAAAAEGGDASD